MINKYLLTFEYVEICPEVIELLKKLSLEKLNNMKRSLGIDKFNADLEGFKTLKALYLAPSINISSIYSGYINKGLKVVSSIALK